MFQKVWILLSISKFFNNIGNYFYMKHVKLIKERNDEYRTTQRRT